MTLTALVVVVVVGGEGWHLRRGVVGLLMFLLLTPPIKTVLLYCRIPFLLSGGTRPF